jgi:hypothetical protein
VTDQHAVISQQPVTDQRTMTDQGRVINQHPVIDQQTRADSIRIRRWTPYPNVY